MIEGSGSILRLMDPDPEGPKTCGSGSATLDKIVKNLRFVLNSVPEPYNFGTDLDP